MTPLTPHCHHNDGGRGRCGANVCSGGIPQVPHAARGALAALRWLAAQPGVDPARVAVMGWSHGGGAALDVSRLSARDFDFEGWPTFRAAVAWYPPCDFLDVDTKTPTLLLLAGRDDWTPPARCQRDAPGRAAITARVYEEAWHTFDRPAPMRVYLGHRLAYDPVAASAAVQETLSFLDRELLVR